MKSFNSFKEIIDESLTLFDLISQRYLAHISDDKKEESLKEHSELVADYLQKLSQSNGIELCLESMIGILSELMQFKTSSKTKNYCKKIFTDSIILHDLGKVNPNFQVLRMKNNGFKEEDLEQKYYHSFLGSFIFANYFFEKIYSDDSLDEDDKMDLYFIVLLFSNPINKHHSSCLDVKKDYSFSIIDEAFKFLSLYKIELERDFSLSFFTEIDNIKIAFEEGANKEVNFTLFALLKLSYSLLTACDYYATNEYMADIKVDDFGILDENLKRKIITNFKTLKPFNADLFARFDEYTTIPFLELQLRNRKNLNILRQKLNAEVIGNLRSNADNHWYYIEAPTGAGKTNLSLACISELLQLDKSLNKVFYVFPFTTLITQTFQSIQETVGLNMDEMIQLHSKAGFHKKEGNNEIDADYGNEKRLYLDNLFVNYPFCVTSHVRFFDVLKGNGKETNYLLHRLCNSIVVIDELQTYDPKHWDKIVFFIENYARLFNMRFILMSATLPKIDALSETAKGKFISLTPSKHHYFTNPNFAGRIEFDFSLLNDPKLKKFNKETYLKYLAEFMKSEADKYYLKYGKSRVLIEFITKNTASHFYRLLNKEAFFQGYRLRIISGDILEPRRKEVINEIKNETYDKIIIVSTQVIEAGVDIDMDLGFKDRSLLDSDEQLAGRINRNASKEDCKVFLFDCDSAKVIYGKDNRYKHQQQDKEIYHGFKDILINKTFDLLYEKVFEDVNKEDWTDKGKLEVYLKNFGRFDFQSINKEFQLIEDSGSEQIFIPIEIENTINFPLDLLTEFGLLTDDGKRISGEKLFDTYMAIIRNQEVDFIKKLISLKKIIGLMSQFTISVYSWVLKELGDEIDYERSNYGFIYLSHWRKCYDYKEGFDFEKASNDIFL